MTTDNPASPQREIAPGVGVDLFATARKVVRLDDLQVGSDAYNALACDIDNEILTAAYELAALREQLAAAQALPGKWREDVELNGSKEWPSCGMQLALADELDAALGQRAAMGGENNG